METKKTVLELLENLGQTETEVAENLEKFPGKRFNICNCPIAIYLKSNGFSSVQVQKKIVADGLSYSMPLPVSDFIRAFDGGIYPHLILR